MDLLGSILGSMNGPPSSVLSEKEKERRKRMKAYQEKMKEKHRCEMEAFRSKMEKEVEVFLQECPSEKSKTFPTMNQVQRSMLKDISEVAGLVAFSFGEEEVDRHVVLWKMEFSPSEEELACIRRGEKYDPIEFARRKEMLKEQERQEQEERDKISDPKSSSTTPVPSSKSSYLNKFKGRIDTSSPEAVNAKKSYGMVSAESKKDKRTVEEVQAEIRAKKRAKLEGEEDGP
uniref:Sperm-associated antigen 7 n=1 Tax=Caligus clemensi TaxID=344056 RepID=C1C315_CALCM|nr:Sperm-associated antigen 7 [Caligus clemensi]